MSRRAILVVDDHPTNLKLARVLLQGEGYEVQTAVDALDALRVLETFTPHLILMDIQLPDIDGLELTRRLKADKKWQAVNIVALTAFAMKGDEEKALASGCDGYITKPIDPDTLPAMLAAYFDTDPRATATSATATSAVQTSAVQTSAAPSPGEVPGLPGDSRSH